MRGAHYDPVTRKRVGFVPPGEEEKLAKREAEKAERAEERERAGKLALLERAQKAQFAREDLLAFTQFTMPDPADPDDVSKSAYEAQVFHREVAKALEAVERGEIIQLIFAMPPRHGKSLLATKSFASWYSGRHPEQDIAVASYSDTMAEDFGADIRAIMNSAAYKQVFPAFKLRRGGAAKSNIQTDRGGRLVCVGRGGALTGRGANLLLIDDLYKDHEEARSQTIRDQAWNWFTKVAMTRRMGKKLVVITMTRWHSDDIVGRLTDPENPNYNAIEAAKWKIIRLPAIAEDDDPLGRKPGEVLWPERYDLDFMESQQRLDPLGYAALYQQRPTVADGVLFRRESIRYYGPDDLPKNLRYYCASDHAYRTAERNDFTVMLKVGVDDQNNIYLVDCYWNKVPADVAVEAMLTMASGDKPPLIWWAEKGHITGSIGPFLHKRMRETGTYINIREVTPVSDKEQRAQSIAARVAMGYVWFPRNSPWTEKAVDQLMAFPGGTRDDFCDSLAYIGLGLQSQFGASKPKERPKEPQFGTLGWVKRAESWAKVKQAEAKAGGF